MSAARYAIYFTPPPFSRLSQFGAGVLGYDCFQGIDVAHVLVGGIDPAVLALITVEPRRYGFHATIVAPFFLKGGSEDNVLDELRSFCHRNAPVQLGRLRLAAFGSFVALVPENDVSRAIARLADGCVQTFDPYCAPPSEPERTRRALAGLTPRQAALMERWGYPYVFDQYRFHMTLTGPLPDEQRAPIVASLEAAFAGLADNSIEVDALSLLRQDDGDRRFRVIERFRLRGQT